MVKPRDKDGNKGEEEEEDPLQCQTLITSEVCEKKSLKDLHSADLVTLSQGQGYWQYHNMAEINGAFM